MAQLPFSQPPPPEPRKKQEPPSALTVSQLAGRIKDTLADGFPGRIRVVGEISNYSARSAGGHWFFSLKDGQSSIRCVMFASAARKVGFPVRDGMEVVISGRVDFYNAQGSVQLYAETMQPVGQGALEQELRRLMEELRGKGYFAPETKLPLPTMPTTIAVVTSRNAAALQDVINTTRRRWPGCRLLLKDVRVQGDLAAPEIAEAIRLLSDHGREHGVDAIILTRGGGSIEDLWAFNERIVADAVHDCTLPIVAAIGHETDTTIAELVADHRCATPTQAAMTLVPDAEGLAQQVDHLSHRLRLCVRRVAEAGRSRLDRVARHALFQSPDRLAAQQRDRLSQLERRLAGALPRRITESQSRVGQQAKRLDAALARRAATGRAQLDAAAKQLDQAVPRRVVDARQRLEALAKHLEAVGPQQVLSRGYTYTTQADGKLLRSAAEAAPGESLTTVFADGQVTSVVASSETDAPTPKPVVKPKPAAAPAKRRSRKPKGPEGPGLFG